MTADPDATRGGWGEDFPQLPPPDERSDGWACRADRALQVLRYYRKRQLLCRARKTARRRLFGPIAGRAGMPRPADDAVTLQPDALARLRDLEHARRDVRAPDDMAVDATALRAGRFRLLNREVDLGSPIDWRASCTVPPLSHLGRFHLHYQACLLGLVRSGEAGLALDLIRAWIDGNPFADPAGHDDAWHPYCISRRLPAWLTVLAVTTPEARVAQPILSSAAQQARHLHDNLEWDVRGNHLIENLRALTVAGHVLDSPETPTWLQTVERVLPGQLREQVLPHGEHFERSPMYHVQVLAGLVEMAAVSGPGSAIADTARPVIASMGRFLDGVLHPDGEIPLFGDSCFGEAPPVAEVRAGLEHVTPGAVPPSEPDAGATPVGPYWVARHGDDRLIFDTGAVAADALPAHGHCDLLTFEGSIGGRRWFVDGGIFNYEDGEMRRYCRSTCAHNTVEIDGQNQCDVWSRFRMGRRGRVSEVRDGVEDGWAWRGATHDAYRHRGVTRLGRLMTCRDGVWCCEEQIDATGRHRAVGRLHLHPSVAVAPEVGAPGNTFRLSDGHVTRLLRFTGVGAVREVRGWYCPGFGRRAASTVLEYEAQTDARSTCCFGWVLAATPHGLAEGAAFRRTP